MYEDIREQIRTGKKEKQQILVLGDFNSKIEAAIEGNKTQVTTGRRQLLKLTNKENMIILNRPKKVQRSMDNSAKRRKAFNYVLTDTLGANAVKEMKIDEEKQYELHKLEKNTATSGNKKKYTDHGSVLINLDFETATEEQRPQ